MSDYVFIINGDPEHHEFRSEVIATRVAISMGKSQNDVTLVARQR